MVLLLVGLGAWIIARTSLSPLQRFHRLAASIGKESLSQRISTAGLPTELTHLAREFNAMLERIDLVLVATGAIQRQREKRLARGGDDVVEAVVACLQRITWLVVPDAEAVVAGGDERLGRDAIELVAGELLAEERVVWLVAVEGVDVLVSELGAANFQILSSPRDSEWGRRAVVVDPDGQRVELLENHLRS